MDDLRWEVRREGRIFVEMLTDVKQAFPSGVRGIVFYCSAPGGCTVGPKYKRPTYATPAAYRGPDESALAADAQGIARRPGMVAGIS